MQPSAETFEDLVRVSRKRSHRRALALTAVGLLAAMIGVATAYRSYFISRQKTLTVEKLAVTQQKLQDSTASQQKTKARDASISALLADGVQQAHIGRFAIAEKDYDRVLQLDPNNSDALQFKGYLELRQGKVDEAVALLRHAVSVAPGDPWAHYNLSLALFRSGDRDGAVEQIRQLLQNNPGFSETIAKDPQFRLLRRQPEVQKLLAQNPGA